MILHTSPMLLAAADRTSFCGILLCPASSIVSGKPAVCPLIRPWAQVGRTCPVLVSSAVMDRATETNDSRHEMAGHGPSFLLRVRVFWPFAISP